MKRMSTWPGSRQPGPRQARSRQAGSRNPGSVIQRIGWFIGIWAASIVVVAAIAEGLKHIILG